MANAVTGVRLICSLLLLAVPPWSGRFLALYLACGLSDLLDGAIARRTGTATPLGARLDTLADLVFAAVCLARLLPLLPLPGWLWGWTAGIAVVKLLNLLSGLLRRRHLVVEHTVLNKITGALLFALPLTLGWVNPTVSGSLVCLAASCAALQEGWLVHTDREIV